jgi:hypothetical protein
MVEYKEPPTAKAMNRTYIGETLFETIRFMENQWKFGFIPRVKSDSQKLVIACGCLFEQFEKSLAADCVLAFRIAGMFAQTNQLVANSDRVADSVEVMQKDVSTINESIASIAAQEREVKRLYQQIEDRDERMLTQSREMQTRHDAQIKELQTHHKTEIKELYSRHEKRNTETANKLEALQTELNEVKIKNRKMRLDWSHERKMRESDPQQRRDFPPPPPPPPHPNQQRSWNDSNNRHIDHRSNNRHIDPRSNNNRFNRKRNRRN